MHYYTAYGLTIVSELECPELTAVEPGEESDITIALAELSPRIDNPRHSTQHVQVSEDLFQFEQPGVARYRVIGGHIILIKTLGSSPPEEVRLHLLGTVFGALLHQQGRLPLHASAVEQEGGGIAFCGHSGAGKSTLATALNRRGLALLCDDVGVVVPNADGAPLFYPGFPRVKLWQDALHHFELDPKTLTPDWRRAEKYQLNLQDRFQLRPLPLRQIWFLEYAVEGENAAVHPLTPTQGVPLLVANTYRPSLARWLGDFQAHFHRCARIAESVALGRYVRPRSLTQLDASLDVLVREGTMIE
ncbi:hypothetical protein Thimo_3580 [Thioflavicoccus mobilis 8321]|uniref:Serine kinase of the HPr protein, regulates carbohydrate metabolism n=1 Tax=Thioflavicoccus mobilis 8321 TaxID=765912 RepID=L0H1W9_9GAMM|nr:hypothetical protein [Thioflavicoccus mobilis]AGA92236.1 hypothetical protein Thimo_3580 [Thioflavicoccus mobilis 8321]